MRSLSNRGLGRGVGLGSLLALAVLASCAAVPRISAVREARFDPVEPAVVAFTAPFDPLRDTRSRDEYAATIQSMRATLTTLRECAGVAPVGIHLILADQLIVLSPAGAVEIEASEAAQIVLMGGGTAPVSLELGASPDDPSAVGSAAARYFSAPRCRPPEP